MLKRYVLLDVKNPNTKGNSICAIAVIVVEKNIVIEQKCTLINPEDTIDAINTEIIGIDEKRFEKAPTFKEYWDEIKTILKDNVIIGHNIIYKLAVLSAVLKRYNIKVPKFRYLCTLELAKKHINTDCYRLENLCKSIGYTYDSQVVFEDAIAARKLFEYMKRKFDGLGEDVQTFYFRRNDIKEQEEFPFGCLFQLFGFIQGILVDEVITDTKIECLYKWISDNAHYKKYTMFENIIQTLTVILEDKRVNQYDKLRLRSLINRFSSYGVYCVITPGFQIIQGFLDGLFCDDISMEKVKKLEFWLQDYNYLTGLYPYDKLVMVVNEIIREEDFNCEKKWLLFDLFEEIKDSGNVHGQVENEFPLENKAYCLTGEFSIASRSIINKKLKEKGAIENRGVSMKLDYLFVGGMSYGSWEFGNFGDMISRALELREKGEKVVIISEEELEGLL